MSKKKASKGGDELNVVSDYLRRQNRPFSIALLQVSLKDYGKAAIERSVDSLVADGSVTMKEFGKTKLYWWKQEDAPEGEGGMQKLDETIKTLKEELSGVQDEVKRLTSESKSLESSLTNEQLTERIAKLRQENSSLTKKLETLKSGARLVSPEERKAAEAKYQKATNYWRSRKRKCREITDMLEEMSEKKYKDLVEDLGLELDEDAGVSLDDDPLAPRKKAKR